MEPGYFWGKKFESIWTKDSRTVFLFISKHLKSIVSKALMKNWNDNLCRIGSLYKMLDRYIISYKHFAVPTEKDPLC